ncbi:MAG: helix-turn-helix transcriptional regulator [Aerococcus sp.]|nr:helix-turn-helix transcriptional regulator [Aerococcus sp.]
MDESEKKARKTAARDQASEKAADILLKIRRERNLSQVQLAQVSGRKQSYISRVESRQQNISLGTLQEIVNAVDGELVIDVKL